jgi:cyclic beta-1,2-glucan synthetase
MYRVGIEGLLGLRRRADALHIDPCIPRNWPRYEILLKLPRAEYRIVVENPDGVSRGVVRVEVDGVEQADRAVPIVEDGGIHHVEVVLGT